MGLQRPAKMQKSTFALLSTRRVSCAAAQVTDQQAVMEELPGTPEKLNCPGRRVPLLKLPISLPPFEQSEQADCADEAKSSLLLAGFEDFWGSGDDEPTPCGDRADTMRIGTPRRATSKQPLQIFKMTDSPPSSPSAQANEKAEKKAFVPYWPFGQGWPFCVAPTTLELRGLPRDCTAEMLISQLDAWGFAGRYDFVYVPTRSSTGDVAFVNTVRHADGCALSGRLHDFSDWNVVSKKHLKLQIKRKACRVAWSFNCQGLESLIQHFQWSNQSWWFTPDGGKVGPWLRKDNVWTPLFSPEHTWGVTWEASAAKEEMVVQTPRTKCAAATPRSGVKSVALPRDGQGQGQKSWKAELPCDTTSLNDFPPLATPPLPPPTPRRTAACC